MIGRKRPRGLLALASGVALSLTIGASVLGYSGEVPANVTVTTAGSIVPNSPIALSATVLGASATGVPGVSVTFAITCAPAGASDSLSATTADTNASGVATVYITLSAVAGQRCVTATAEGGVLGEVSINLEPGSLPNTSTSASSPPPAWVPILLVLAAFAAGSVVSEVSVRSRGKRVQ